MGFAVLMFFWCGDALNKISICGVEVISNLTVCDVCVFDDAVFGEMKLFAVLWFLVWLGDAVFVYFFCSVAVFRAPPCPLPVACSNELDEQFMDQNDAYSLLVSMPVNKGFLGSTVSAPLPLPIKDLEPISVERRTWPPWSQKRLANPLTLP